ncbi:MAG: heat-inducible transcription repressor HrcA [Clostridiales bacterium]|nr:heat-inducible transcription repressor HrcA [Clostridiales bacterium]
MFLDERKLQILQAIIGDFISSAEPVGSRTLSKKYDMGISPATIRNEMSDLEAMGFLTHVHTSSGRIPSNKAYRYYVDALMESSELSPDIKATILKKLTVDTLELEDVVKRAASLLSEITNLTSFALTPRTGEDILKYVKLLPLEEDSVVLMIVSESGKVSNMTIRLKEVSNEEHLDLLSKVLTYNYRGKSISQALTSDIEKEIQLETKALGKLTDNIMPGFMRTLAEMLNVQFFLEGLTNIFDTPEYADMYKAKAFLEMLNRKDEFLTRIIEKDQGITITIGDENRDELLNNCSLITATYHIDGKFMGRLGVIGPTRMKYDEVTSVIKYLTDNIENTFKMKEGNRENDQE